MGTMKEFASLYYRSETLYRAMRGAARATWSTIKHIPGIEDANKGWQTQHERAQRT